MEVCGGKPVTLLDRCRRGLSGPGEKAAIMSVTALSIAFVAVCFVASGVIFLLLWERARIGRGRGNRYKMNLTKKGN